MTKFLLLIMLVHVFSCNGGMTGNKQHNINDSILFTLSIRGESQVQYFSRIFLRVSYPEGLYEDSKEGRFMPGDDVVFKLGLPPGRERTIEVILFDPQGRPIYYRSLFLGSLLERDTIRVELQPSEGTIKTYELRSDGKIERERVLRLFSEDLYSYNGEFNGYLVGKFVGLSVGKRIYFEYVADENRFIEMYFDEDVRLEVLEAENLELSGSADGYVENDGSIYTVSSRITSQGEALLCAVENNEVYFAFSSGELNMLKYCPSENCKSYELSYPENYNLSRPVFVFRGIKCNGGYVSESDTVYFPNVAGSLHYAGLNFNLSSVCEPKGYMYKRLYETNERLFPQIVTFRVPSPSTWRMYSQDGFYFLEASCQAPNSLSFVVPYLEDKEVTVEHRLGNTVYAKRIKLSQLDNWEWEGDNIKEFVFEKRNDHLLVKYELMGSFRKCHLFLKFVDLEVYINNIPTHRRYFKLRITEKPLVQASLRCELNNGYVEKFYSEVLTTALCYNIFSRNIKCKEGRI